MTQIDTPSAVVGESGRRGSDVRSDAFVRIEGRASGGIEIDLQSKVAALYADSIRQQAKEVLRELGIEHAFVSIEDQGALAFTLSARIESAAHRAGLTQRTAFPERLPVPPATAKDRVRRSRLYLPGNEPKYFVNAILYHADGIILDLEDSVHREVKDSARIVVRNALRAVDFGNAERMVRINQGALGFEDLDEIVPELPDLVLIPKVEHAHEVVEVDRRITGILSKNKIDRPLWIMPILESAVGIENAYAIATASPRIVALTIGLEDYTADIGVPKTKEGSESLFARMRLVNAARAAGVEAIDSVWGDVGDMDGLKVWARQSRALGFTGMGNIHPGQIALIHEAFAPSASEIEKAQKIVAAFEEAQARGLGVVSLGSKMIDPPVVLRAVKLVEQAKAMGLI